MRPFPLGGVHQDLPPKLIDDIDAWCDPFLQVVALETLLTGNRIFKQRNVDIGVVSLKHGLGVGSPRDGARLGAAGTCAVAALRMLRRNGFRHPIGKNGDCHRTASGWKRCAIGAYHEAVHSEAARA